MKYDPYKHHRRSIRLKGFDYTQEGWYYVTLCTYKREHLFGEIVNGQMVLNTFGKIIDYHWRRLPFHFKNIELDEYQIMPNHMHGIIHIVGVMHSVPKDSEEHKNSIKNTSPLPPHGTMPGSLGAIIQNFSSVTTRKINKIRKTQSEHLWRVIIGSVSSVMKTNQIVSGDT